MYFLERVKNKKQTNQKKKKKTKNRLSLWEVFTGSFLGIKLQYEKNSTENKISQLIYLITIPNQNFILFFWICQSWTIWSVWSEWICNSTYFV